MRSIAAVVTAILVVGCASGGSTVPVSDPVSTVNVGPTTFDYTVHPDVQKSDARDVPATLAETWAALPAVYKKLGLAVTGYDTASHTIVGERVRSRRSFGTRPLNSLVDCGDVAGVPAIDHDDVNLQVRTMVEDAGKTSAVSSIASASAEPSGTSGTLSQCTVNRGIADEIASTLTAMVHP